MSGCQRTEVYIVRVDVFVYCTLQFHNTYVICTCFARERGSESPPVRGSGDDGIRGIFSMPLAEADSYNR